MTASACNSHLPSPRPAARQYELDELTQIYVECGLSCDLVRRVAEELTAADVR